MYLADEGFLPMSGATVVSALGQDLLDSATTDSNGLTQLDVADGGFVTVHYVYSTSLLVHQSVVVQPTDSSLTIRFRFPDKPQPATLNASVDVSGVPTGFFVGGRVSSGWACSEKTPANGTTTLQIVGYCSEQENGRYSVWGFAYDLLDSGNRSRWHYAAAHDVAFETTSLALDFQPDAGADVDVTVTGLPSGSSWNGYGSARWSGVPIGPGVYPSVSGSAGTFVILGTGDADSMVLSAWWDSASPGSYFGETAWIPPGQQDWSADATLHPQTVSSAAIAAAAGSLTASWTSGNDGYSDHTNVVVQWQDETGRYRIWLLVLPAWAGNVAFDLPPVPLSVDPTSEKSNLAMLVRYTSLDYVDSYEEARFPPPLPDTRIIRSSWTRSGPPGQPWWYPAE